MASPTKVDLGAFALGELPYPIKHFFQNATGQAYDITGWTPFVSFEGDGINLGAGTVTVTDGSNGEVTYNWTVDDFLTEGPVRMLFWVQNTPTTPTVRLASYLFTYTVYDGPGTTPTS